jgi:hypothetical protein
MARRRTRTPGPLDAYRGGLKTSIRNNATAYGYSLTATMSLAVLASELGTPTVGQVLLFGLGAVSGFVTIEAAASGLFRGRTREEPAEVVVFGSALSFASVGLGVGAAALAGTIIDGGAAWPIATFLATVVYLLVVGVELALAEQASG